MKTTHRPLDTEFTTAVAANVATAPAFASSAETMAATTAAAVVAPF